MSKLTNISAETFKPGDRVSSNAAFENRFPRMKSLPKSGTIIAATTNTQYSVLWDGRKWPEPIHVTLLQPVSGGAS